MYAFEQMSATPMRTAGEPHQFKVQIPAAPALPDRFPLAMALAAILGIVFLAGCASPVRHHDGAELDRLVGLIAADPDVRAQRGMPALGNLIYALIFEAHGTTPKPAVISDEQLRSGLLAEPGSRVIEPWIYWFGAGGRNDAKPLDIVRLYFNLMPDRAVPAMDRLTAELNHAHLKFTLKVASSVVAMQRSSSAVLYVNRSDYRIARRAAAATSEALPSSFADSCVPLTKRITLGVSAADEPDATFAPKTRPQHSFGTFVSDALAETLLALPTNAPPASVIAAARQCLRAYGVDPDHLYLRRGHTTDDL